MTGRSLLACALLVGCSTAAPRAPEHPASQCAPPGPCVTPLDDAFARLSAVSRVTSRDELELQTAEIDVDHDGAPETWVSVIPERGVTGNEVRLLYVGASCARFAGEVFGEAVTALETSHCGLADLETYADGGCASMAGDIDVMVHDGAVYRRDAEQSASCACPASPEEEGSPLRDSRCPGVE